MYVRDEEMLTGRKVVFRQRDRHMQRFVAGHTFDKPEKCKEAFICQGHQSGNLMRLWKGTSLSASMVK